MSIYTDYLNEHSDIDYKEFIRVCAWNAKQLAPYLTDELKAAPENIELNVAELN